MRVGVDIVKVERIRQLLENAEQAARLFATEEMSDSVESMAGKFAAKEAYFKARGVPGNWRDISVLKRETGEPYLVCEEHDVAVSISHDGEYAIAMVVIE